MEEPFREAPSLVDVTEVVRAAGGIVWRPAPGGDGIEILLIHRPKYGDWTMPKGKLTEGETDEAGALREVEEETGLRCSLGRMLGSVRYRDRFGRPKIVTYYEMRPSSRSFTPGEEVDRVRWLPKERVVEALSYAHDREILRGVEPAE